jgi:hypothetical protein
MVAKSVNFPVQAQALDDSVSRAHARLLVPARLKIVQTKKIASNFPLKESTALR